MKKSELDDVMLKTKNLFLVDIRFYDAEKGIEKENKELISKAIVSKVDTYYFNVINGQRFPYISGYGKSKDGYISFRGIKNLELMDEKGICYVETKGRFIDDIKKQDEISIRQLEERILYSDLYFKDRIQIIENRVNLTKKGICGIKNMKLARLAKKDWYKNCHYRDRLDQLGNGIQKVKSY